MSFPFLRVGCVLLASAHFASFVPAQAPPAVSVVSLSATPSAETIVIAEPFTVRVEVHAPQGSGVTFAPINDTLGTFEIVDVEDVPDVPLSEKQRRWTRVVSLETLALGEQTVPPMQVSITLAGETAPPETFSTESIPIEVRSVLDEEDQNAPEAYRDIADVIPLPETRDSRRGGIAFAAVTIVTLLTLALAVRLFYRRLANRPHRWCHREAARLKRRSIVDAASYVDASARFKQIVQVWVAGSLNASMQSPATSDLLDSLRKVDCNDDFVHDVRRVLTCADRLRFSSGANGGFRQDEHDSLRRAIEHVERVSRRSTARAGGENAGHHEATV